ncbi:hypothetical protein [Hymenobacter lutimineralis]|nr:hypothetical protein [Hymenobacter lutimineralis]
MTEDVRFVVIWSRRMTRQFWYSVPDWLQTMEGSAIYFQGTKLGFHGFSNTWFFIKILSVLNLVTLGYPWLTAAYLSIVSFAGCWFLARTILRLFPAVPPLSAALALLIWPSCIYWTSGITKEALLTGSVLGCTAWVVTWAYGSDQVQPLTVVWTLLLAYVAFKMRFFFSIFLLAGLGILLLIRTIQYMGSLRSWWSQLVFFGFLFSGGAWAASEVVPVFRANKFTNQVITTYRGMSQLSVGKPLIVYQDLKPTLSSIAQHAPVAIFNTLSRPWPGESPDLRYQLLGLENVGLLGLLVVSLLGVIRKKAGTLPFALVLVFLWYCVVVALFIGLTTPNLGTLTRYRTAFLPFLLLLLLQNDYAAAVLRRLPWPRK